MGFYLNNTRAYDLYNMEIAKSYFVDKSMILAELFPLVTSGNNHICITRPRRFGKTVMANMIVSFFQRRATQPMISEAYRLHSMMTTKSI